MFFGRKLLFFLDIMKEITIAEPRSGMSVSQQRIAPIERTSCVCLTARVTIACITRTWTGTSTRNLVSNLFLTGHCTWRKLTHERPVFIMTILRIEYGYFLPRIESFSNFAILRNFLSCIKKVTSGNYVNLPKIETFSIRGKKYPYSILTNLGF